MTGRPLRRQAVHRRRAHSGPFLAKFRAALAALEPGNPRDEATTLGPLSTESAAVDLMKQVDVAVAHGAKVLIGGKRLDRPGAFMQPTILTDVAPGNPAFRDEFFGPVAMFFRVKDEDAAIALANDSDFGLGGSVFTKDTERGKRVGQPRRDRNDVYQQHLLVRCRTPVRRHQGQRLRKGTRRYGDPGIRQQKAGPHLGGRSAALINSLNCHNQAGPAQEPPCM
jgi:hypothetical protein